MTKRESFNNGLYWFNSSRCLAIYNKSNELHMYQNKKVEENLLRFEYRLLNKNVIQRHTAIKQLGDLYSDVSYSTLENVFYTFMESSFLDQSFISDKLDSITYLKNHKNSRGSIAKMFAAQYCLENLNSTELNKILLAAGYSKKHMQAFSNEVKEINMQLNSKPELFETMYREIEHKLLDRG